MQFLSIKVSGLKRGENLQLLTKRFLGKNGVEGLSINLSEATIEFSGQQLREEDWFKKELVLMGYKI